MKIERVLMCKPTYFDIEYSINPYMDINNKVDKRKAQDQWDAAYHILAELGVKIETIDPVPGLPDMTFTGDCGMVHGNKFIMSNFRYIEREPEAEVYAAWLAAHGYPIYRLPQAIYFEGLGDIIYYDNDIIFGYGPRSSPESLGEVRRILPELNIQAELHLNDDSFYHTALAISLIDRNTVIYYPQAFTEESRKLIEATYSRRIAVGEQDAKEYFICNNIPIDKNILVDNCTPTLEQQLNVWGYEIIRCDMSEFKKSGGSVRCLILKL